MMMSFGIGGPIQQPPALPRNLTQSLGLPNFTTQYGSGLAQDLRGQLFLFTGNPANSPLIETMAYSQIPNFTLPVSQFNPNNPLNASIDSLYNAPLLQNGVLGGGMFQSNGSTVGGGQTGSIFAPQQSTQQGFPTFPPQQQQGGFQPIPQQQQLGGGATQPPQQQPIYGYQPQPQTGIQSLVSPVTNGVSQQQSTLQNLINPMSLSQFTSTVGGTPVGQGYASPVMQGYGMSQQQQFNPYAAQSGYPPYATAGGQIIYG